MSLRMCKTRKGDGMNKNKLLLIASIFIFMIGFLSIFEHDLVLPLSSESSLVSKFEKNNPDMELKKVFDEEKFKLFLYQSSVDSGSYNLLEMRKNTVFNKFKVEEIIPINEGHLFNVITTGKTIYPYDLRVEDGNFNLDIGLVSNKNSIMPYLYIIISIGGLIESIRNLKKLD